MNEENIIELIDDSYECDHLDFKAIEYGKDRYESLIKDVMGMANSDYQGDKYIICGIKEIEGKKEVLGLCFISSINS